MDKIIFCLCEKLKLSEWKNTTEVINWFENIDEKHLHTFTIFDMRLVPVSKRNFIEKRQQFAAEHTDINKNNFEIMFHARNLLLFNSNQPWVKRDSNTFDVTMGAYDVSLPKFVN